VTLWQVQTQHFSLKSRLVFLAAGIGAFLASYSVGIFIPLTDDEARITVEEFTANVEGIEQGGIFSNNAVIGFGMFIPAAGAGLGIYAAISTGMVFNAFARVIPEVAAVSPFSVFATSFGILELFAYGLAISRSGILAFDLIKKRPWRRYLVVTLIEIGIVVVVLLVGSIVEAQFIGNFQ
jgi:hypothetical protein